MSYRLLTGDVRAMLATLETGSVSLCVTSPPYHGQRAYGTPPVVWDEPAGGCAHEWQPFTRPGQSGGTASAKVQIKGQENFQIVPDQQQAACMRSGCWLGELGSEPDVEAFIRHLCDVFEDVRRVLHPTGVLAVNLGDSYASEGMTGGGSPVDTRTYGVGGTCVRGRAAERRSLSGGTKAKDLMLVPSRFALEMQRRGWWVRSFMPWVKFGSAMPESVEDRPSNALEWIVLLSKSRTYYWDPTAVRRPHLDYAGGVSRFGAIGSRGGYQGGYSTGRIDETGTARPSFALRSGGREYNPGGRSYRNSDPLLTVLDAEIEATHARLQALHALRTQGGLWGDEDGDPLALLANPHATTLAHFATFPEALVRPFVAAGSSERGVCGECHAPWERETEPTPEYRERLERGRQHEAWGGERRALASTIGNAFGAKPESGIAEYETLGWRPTCAHGGEPVPGVVLDCFSGTGTTGVVALAMGRDYLGIELSPDYVALAEARLGRSQATLF